MRNIAKIMNAVIKSLAKAFNPIQVGHWWRGRNHDLQLPLHHQRPSPNNSTFMLNDQEVVNALSLVLHPVISLVKLLLGDVSGGCQDLDAFEESFVVVFSLERSDLVGSW